MKKLYKMMAMFLSVIMVVSCMMATTALAAEGQKNYDEVKTYTAEALAVMPRLTTLFTYDSNSFYIENNEGTFKSSVSSSDARIVVGAIRADGIVDGTITVDVYKKNLIGKTRVMRYTCNADGNAHTSGSFSVSKNADYVVDIYTSTTAKSIVSVIIAAG